METLPVTIIPYYCAWIHGHFEIGQKPTTRYFEKAPREVAFQRLIKEQGRLTVFYSLFRKQLRLFNETSGVNLAYVYDAIVPSKRK